MTRIHIDDPTKRTAHAFRHSSRDTRSSGKAATPRARKASVQRFAISVVMAAPIDVHAHLPTKPPDAVEGGAQPSHRSALHACTVSRVECVAHSRRDRRISSARSFKILHL